MDKTYESPVAIGILAIILQLYILPSLLFAACARFVVKAWLHYLTFVHLVFIFCLALLQNQIINTFVKGRVQKKKLEFSNRGGGGPEKKIQLFQKQCHST